MKKALNAIVQRISDTCRENNIFLEMRWLRRDKNKLADKLSRWVDLDDWGTNDELFGWLQNKFGQCDVDRFASDKNNKLSRFNSQFSCPNAEAVNGLAQDWNGSFSWLAPPPILIPRALEHLQSCKARAILVAPFWPPNAFWPFLFSWNGPANFVKWWRKWPDGQKYLVDGSQPGSIFTCKDFRSPLLTCYLDAGS